MATNAGDIEQVQFEAAAYRWMASEEQKKELRSLLAMGATRGMLFNQAMAHSDHKERTFSEAKVHVLECFVEMEAYLKEVTK